MTHDLPDRAAGAAFAHELSRRRLLGRVGAVAAAAGLLPLARAADVVAQGATPTAAPVNQAELQGLLSLSPALCGGGNFDPGQGTMLLQLLSADADLHQGLTELLAAPPTATAAPNATPTVPSAQAQAATQAILLFWYTGTFNGNPIANRATAYYQLTAWQAMYTPPWAVCKAFGGWEKPPAETPLVPSA